MTWKLHDEDCLSALPRLDGNSLDACVTDPPYHLTSIVKRFGGENAASAKFGTDGAYARASAGFMGKVWDGGDVAFRPETWREVYRVLKPGAHLLAFGGTRTFHRLACAIEDAGFEIRDTISWLYGAGFPKSHDVSKGIDKAAGEQRERIRGVRSGVVANTYAHDAWSLEFKDSVLASEPITNAAREWQGWGTALKPACELIVLARKPLSEDTVAANVLRWGTGAINIDGCRVETDDAISNHGETGKSDPTSFSLGARVPMQTDGQKFGRWPANVIHDGSEEVMAAFPESESRRSVITSKSGDIYGGGNGLPSHTGEYGFNNSGSTARFFYTAKADADDRLGSRHPTVKPLDLMQYLVRLVTPKGGTVLDLFAGTGTTGEAALREGMSVILIEREPEYQADIRRRMALVWAGPNERIYESVKAKNLPRDDGPLFQYHDDYNATDDFAKSIDLAYATIRARKAAGGDGWEPP